MRKLLRRQRVLGRVLRLPQRLQEVHDRERGGVVIRQRGEAASRGGHSVKITLVIQTTSSSSVVGSVAGMFSAEAACRGKDQLIFLTLNPKIEAPGGSFSL